jgi:ribosomal protein L7/L12
MDQLLEKRLNLLAQAIGRLERKTDFILKELKLEYTDDLEGSVAPELAEVVAFLKQNKKMDAIRAYRAATGAELAEAQAAVEKMQLGTK